MNWFKRGFDKKLYLGLRGRVLLLFTFAFTVLFSMGFYWFYTFTIERAKEDLYASMETMAEAAATNIDGDMHQALVEDPDYDPDQGWPEGMADARYWEIAAWLYDVHLSSDGKAFLYTYIEKEPGVVMFVASHGAVLDPVDGAEFGWLYEPQPPSLILEGMKQGTLSTEVVEDDWGEWVSYFEPIRNSAGEIVGAVGVDHRPSEIIELENRLQRLFFQVYGIGYILLMGMVFFTTNRVTAPIESLTEAAEKMSGGEYKQLALREGVIVDEVVRLEQVFNEMVEKVQAREVRLEDMSEKLERARAQLQELSRQLMVERETEQIQLARELHDDVLNLVAEMTIGLEADFTIERVQRSYQELSERIRRAIYGLRPPMLNFGLVFGIEDHVRTCRERAGDSVMIIYAVEGDDVRYDPNVEMHIFRIVQQALDNALEHADAGRIWIEGKVKEDLLALVVRDDGKGFEMGGDVAGFVTRGQFGLLGMRERAAMIGGELQIETGSGKGTAVHLRVDFSGG